MSSTPDNGHADWNTPADSHNMPVASYLDGHKMYVPGGKAPQTVILWMRVENVTPRVLEAESAQAAFEAAIKDIVAREAGSPIQPHMVDVTGGPLLLQCKLVVPCGFSVHALKDRLDASESLGGSLSSRIKSCLEEAGAAVPGPVSISNISEARIRTAFEGTWRRESNIYSIEGATVYFPSGGEAKLNVTSPHTFDITHQTGISISARHEPRSRRLTWSNGSVWEAVVDEVEPQEEAASPAAGREVAEDLVRIPVPGEAVAEPTSPVWPQYWGTTPSECRSLLRELRKDPAWDTSNSVGTLVSDFIVPMTRGKGVSYALLRSQSALREVNVMVAYSWAQNAEEFLEAVVRSTTPRDVLFISALSMYQAEDGLGPSLAEQLDSRRADSSFERVLRQIRMRGAYAGWRWKRRRVVYAPPAFLLAVAVLLFYSPIILWGCVPTYDMTQCLTRTFPEDGSARGFEWVRSGHYEHDWSELPGWLRTLRGYVYVAASALAGSAVVMWLVLRKCTFYDGRLLMVPGRDTELNGRLWCVAHYAAASSLGVPTVLANSLAPLGRCRSEEAECSGLSSETRIRQDIEERAGGPKCYQRIDRGLLAMARRERMWQWFTVSMWVLAWTLLRAADLHLVLTDSWRRGSATSLVLPFCVLGALVGALSSGCGMYCMAKSAKGAPSLRSVCACAILLVGAGALTFFLLNAFEAVRGARLERWSDAVDLLSDEGYRHIHTGRCTGDACQWGVAFATSLAQTLLIGGGSLLIFMLGGLCSPACLKRHQCATAFAGVALVALVAVAAFFARLMLSATGAAAHHSPILVLPEPRDAFGIVVFSLTQVSARCLIPLGGIWAGTLQFGVSVARRGAHASCSAHSRGADSEDTFCVEEVPAGPDPAVRDVPKRMILTI